MSLNRNEQHFSALAMAGISFCWYASDRGSQAFQADPVVVFLMLPQLAKTTEPTAVGTAGHRRVSVSAYNDDPGPFIRRVSPSPLFLRLPAHCSVALQARRDCSRSA